MRFASRLFNALMLFVVISPLAFAQSTRLSSFDRDAVSAYPDLVQVVAEGGGATVYTDRATFEADCGSTLVTETFEEANVAAAGFEVVGAPLPPEDGFVFASGSIETGLVITVDSLSGLSDDLFVSGAGFAGAASIQVGNVRFPDKLRHEFGPNVDCAGYDVDLNRLGTATAIDAVDAAGNVLGTVSISGFATQFIGFKSTSPKIAAIVAHADLSQEWVDTDNVSFGDMEGGCALSINSLSVTPNPIAPGATLRIMINVANSGGPQEVSLMLVYSGQVSGMFNLGSATVPTTTGLMQMVRVRVPSDAPSGAYTLVFNLKDSSGNICDSETRLLTVSAPRIGQSGAVAFEPAAGGLASATATATTVSPNPFTDAARIAFTTDATADVRLAVYDVLGREVAVLVDGALDAGAHRATFNANDLAAGTYVYRLSVGNDVQTGRITLAR